MMQVQKHLAFALIFLSFTLFACAGNEPSGEASTPPAAQPSDSLPKEELVAEPAAPKDFDRSTHNLACLLAGMPVDSQSDYYKYSQTAEWKSFAKNMDESWAKGKTERFDVMRKWVADELGDIHSIGGDLFYPFSGPDAFHALTFFPDANNYHLFALEPAGDLPNLKDASNAQMMNYCNSIQNAIRDFFNSSFFYTIHMAKDMEVANGTAGPIAVFLLRTGHTIISFEKLMINEAGELVANTEKEARTIRFRVLDAQGKEKSFVYHSCDISDAGFATRPALRKHIEGLAKNPTFTKSASYLMHRPTFSQIRDIILSSAPAILQDDTGIPYKYYKKDAWTIQFYGNYNGPIPLFAERKEPDLIQAFKEKGAKELPFTMGYHSRRQNDNVIKYIRK